MCPRGRLKPAVKPPRRLLQRGSPEYFHVPSQICRKLRAEMPVYVKNFLKHVFAGRDNMSCIAGG